MIIFKALKFDFFCTTADVSTLFQRKREERKIITMLEVVSKVSHFQFYSAFGNFQHSFQENCLLHFLMQVATFTLFPKNIQTVCFTSCIEHFKSRIVQPFQALVIDLGIKLGCGGQIIYLSGDLNRFVVSLSEAENGFCNTCPHKQEAVGGRTAAAGFCPRSVSTYVCVCLHISPDTIHTSCLDFHA